MSEQEAIDTFYSDLVDVCESNAFRHPNKDDFESGWTAALEWKQPDVTELVGFLQDFSAFVQMKHCETDGEIKYSSGEIYGFAVEARKILLKWEGKQ